MDFRVKPDVVAPGVNVLSAVTTSESCPEQPCFAFFQGTSMATPHLAGSAAVIRGQHPDWTAAQIRSAIVNTPTRACFTASGTETDVKVIGAGRENLLAAVNAAVALDPVSTSFGAVPAGSGRSGTATVTLTNISGGTLAYRLSVGAATGGGVGYSVGPSSVTLAPGTTSPRCASTPGASRSRTRWSTR